VTLEAQGVQSNPLLQDLAGKDFLEGALTCALNLSMTGDDPDTIKHTLNGKGDLRFNDGAIKGVNLTDMVQNVEVAFGAAEKRKETPRTDFSELLVPFTVTNGEVRVLQGALTSPLLRVSAAGEAHLVQETLNFRVEPRFVGTIKGQGDTQKRAGITVPVLVTGTFSSPKFRPDLESVIRGGIQDPSQLKGLLRGEGDREDATGHMKKKLDDLLEGLPLGR
jgi:AsmA protein